MECCVWVSNGLLILTVSFSDLHKFKEVACLQAASNRHMNDVRLNCSRIPKEKRLDGFVFPNQLFLVSTVWISGSSVFPVDGLEIRRSPVSGGILSHYSKQK